MASTGGQVGCAPECLNTPHGVLGKNLGEQKGFVEELLCGWGVMGEGQPVGL